MAEDKSYTVGSAIVQREDGKIAFKEEETPKGKMLSLPGGFVDWGVGFPEAIVQRVESQNGIKFLPTELNGITQNFSPSGKWITNINVAGPLINDIGEKGIYWLSLDEALRKEFRTPDTLVLLNRLDQKTPFGLDFVHLAIPRKNQGLHFSSEPTSFDVVSIVARYANSEIERYALMVCGEGERETVRGKLSLLGGRIQNGEAVYRAGQREMREESGARLGLSSGLIGAFINLSSTGKYVVNFATAVRGTNQPYQKNQDKEASEIRLLTADEILREPASAFRSPDTQQAVLLAHHYFRTGKKFVPTDSVVFVQTEDNTEI